MIIESSNPVVTPLWYEKQVSGGIVVISVTAGQYKDPLYTLSWRLLGCINVCNIIPAGT